MNENEPLILGIDSATSVCSAALVQGDKTLGAITKKMSRGQAEELLVMVDDILKKTNTAATDIDCVAVSVGPGSFTGLRIGLSAARGLALSISRPCIGVSTFEVALGAITGSADSFKNILRQKKLLIAIETRREDIYAQLFDENFSPLSNGAALHEDELVKIAGPYTEELAVAGDGAGRAIEMLKNNGINATSINPDFEHSATAVCEIAKNKYSKGVELSPPKPLYLRSPEAKIPPPDSRAINASNAANTGAQTKL